MDTFVHFKISIYPDCFSQQKAVLPLWSLVPAQYSLNMVMFAILSILSLLAATHSDVSQIGKKISETKRIVQSEFNTIVLYYQPELSYRSEAVLKSFLNNLINPVIIFNQEKVYHRFRNSRKISGLTPILFIETLHRDILYLSLTRERRIVVTVSKTFEEILRHRWTMNDVFVVHDGSNCSIYHYNRFTNTLQSWTDLQQDPLIAATNDLRGFRFSTQPIDPVNPHVMQFIASRLNGTIEISVVSAHAQLLVVNLKYQFKLYHDNGFVPIYLNRNKKASIHVPRLNKPLPSIYVLIDPFDKPSWITLLASVIGLSILRTFLSGKCHLRDFVRNTGLVLEMLTVGTEIHFHRELERILVGLFVLLSVILINAYESLIISYLLSPRFYPEWDTLQLLNESCCWDDAKMASQHNFAILDKCAEVNMRGIQQTNSKDFVQQAHDNSYCRIHDEWAKNVANQYPTFAVSSGLYRWSKAFVNERPYFMWMMGDPVIIEKVLSLTQIYCSEGALSKDFELEDRILHQENVLKPIVVNDLSLVWMIYFVGMVSTMVVFGLEIINVSTWLKKAKEILAKQFHGKNKK